MRNLHRNYTDRVNPGTRSRMALVFLLCTVFVDVLGLGMVLPLLPGYLTGARNASAAVAWVIALFSLCQFLGLPILGALSDRIGRRPFLVTGLLVTSAAYLALAVGRGPIVVFVAVAAAGLASATVAIAQAVIADNTTGADRTRKMGLLSLGYAAGITLGPAAGGLLGASLPWLPPLAASTLALANALLGFHAVTGFADRATAGTARARARLRDLLPLAGVGRMLGRRELRPLYALVLLFNLSLSVITPTVLGQGGTRFGWSALQLGALAAAVGLAAVATQVLLLPFLHRYLGDRGILIAAFPAAAISLVPVILLPTGLPLFPALALFGVAASLAVPCCTALVSHAVPAEDRGVALAGMNAMTSLAMIAGPATAAFLARFAQHRSPWILASAAMAVAAVVVIAVRRESGH